MKNMISFLHKQISKPLMVLVFVALVMILSVGSNRVYGLPWVDSFKFFGAVFLLFYMPGNLLLNYSGMKNITNGGRFFLSLGIGVVVVPVIYLYFRRFAVPDLIIQSFFIFVGLAWCAFVIWKSMTGKVFFQFSVSDLLAATSLLILIVVLLHLSHFTDVRLLDDGFMIRNTYMTESIFHQGLINALRDIWPPPALYASGEHDMSYYHLNMHLQFELVQRLSSIKSLHLTYFYMPFLYFMLLVSLPYLFVRQIGGNHLLGIVAGVLIFGSGFSFVPGMIGVFTPIYPWTLFFTSTIWALFTLNGYIPALIAFFLCIWFLNAFYECASKRNLILITLLAYGAFGFKSSMGLQIAGVCLLTGFLMLTTKQDRKNGISLSLASLLILIVMLLDVALHNWGIGNNIVVLAPFNIFFSALKEQGLSGLPKLFYPLLFILSLIGAFGVRALGLLFLKRKFLKEVAANWLVVFLVIFVISGYVIAELVFLGDPQRVNETGMNNAKWFFTQSLMGAWFLLYIFLVRWEHCLKNSCLVCLIILGLAAPSTIQFLSLRYDPNYVLFDSDDMSIVKYLSDVDPDAVILHPLNNNRPSLASNFAGRSSVVNVFRSFISKKDRSSERMIDVYTFFNVDTNLENRSAVLRKYGVDYVYGPLELDGQMDQLPELKKVKSTSKWSLYQVNR